MCILSYKSDFKSGRLSVDYLWTNCPLLVVYVGLGQPFHEVNKGVNEVNCRRTPDCDSGCRGFEPRFSPHFLLGFQPNTQLKKKSKSPFACPFGGTLLGDGYGLYSESEKEEG